MKETDIDNLVATLAAFKTKCLIRGFTQHEAFLLTAEFMRQIIKNKKEKHKKSVKK